MIQIDLNAKQFQSDLERYKKLFSDFTPLMTEFGIQVSQIWTSIFRKQGDPKWVELSERTLRQRRKEGKGAQILRDEGRLFNSLTTRSAGTVYNLTPLSLEIGTNLEYAAVHQLGSTTKKIPRRPFLPTDKQLTPMVKRVVARFIQEAQF